MLWSTGWLSRLENKLEEQQQGSEIGQWGWRGLGSAGSSVSLIWWEAASRFLKTVWPEGKKKRKVEKKHQGNKEERRRKGGGEQGEEKEGRRGRRDAMEAVEKKRGG